MTNQDKPVELPPIDHDAESFNIGRLPALEMAQKSLANNSKAPKEEEFYPCEPDIFVATYEPVKP